MNRRRITKQIALLFAGSILCFSSISAYAAEEADASKITPEVQKGMDLFQGNKSLKNGGPACIVCHNVNNENVYPGGLFAKDLTNVTETFPGIGGWLMGPDRPAMIATYKDHPIELNEGQSIEAFLNYANANKNKTASMGGGFYLLIGGIVGLLTILLFIVVIWRVRKTKMVKRDIFDRQKRAWDAKY